MDVLECNPSCLDCCFVFGFTFHLEKSRYVSSAWYEASWRETSLRRLLSRIRENFVVVPTTRKYLASCRGFKARVPEARLHRWLCTHTDSGYGATITRRDVSTGTIRGFSASQRLLIATFSRAERRKRRLLLLFAEHETRQLFISAAWLLAISAFKIE